MNLPKVVLLGRPNVGKSSFFNRIVGGRKAVVEAHPGTTRDWHEQKVHWNNRSFVLIDTGGVIPGIKEGIQAQVAKQVEKVIKEADLLIFICDCQEGLTPLDEALFQYARQKGKKMVVVVNKADNPHMELVVSDFWRLKGLGDSEILAISTLHGKGIGDVLDKIVQNISQIPYSEKEEKEEVFPRLAIIGKPNVGKSTLLNRLLGEERVLVNQTPGTTRDSVETVFQVGGKRYFLVDTAGIRHIGKIKEVVEIFSIARTKKVIQKSDLILFVLDSSEGVVKEDLRIARLIKSAWKPCLVLLNKWDLVHDISFFKYSKKISDRLSDISYAPIQKISALKGTGTHTLLNMINGMLEAQKVSITTPNFNKVLSAIQQDPRAPRLSLPKPLKFFYGCQISQRPLTFRVVANFPDQIPTHYRQWFTHQVMSKLQLNYVPIRVEWVGRDGS